MANHTNLPGYPYGNKDPFPHGDANDASEKIVKSPNFDEGSAHAPSADIELSGSLGGGFSFADLFPFFGELDVTDGVTFDAGTAGSITATKRVAIDVHGILSLKDNGGGLGNPGGELLVEDTGTVQLASGAALSAASGSTVTLSGTTDVKGTFTIKAAGGPGSLVIEVGTSNYISGLTQWQSGSQAHFASGSKLTGVLSVENALSTITLKDGIILGLDPARSWTRRAGRVAASTRGPASAITDPPLAMADVWSPLFTAPTLYLGYTSGGGASTTEKAIYEFEHLPPDGSTIAQAVVKSVGESNLDAITQVPTYRLVRWQKGLIADVEYLSNVTNDSHDGTAADWVTVHSTTITVNAHATIDRAYRYGVLVTHALKAGNVPMAFFLDAEATGTVAAINGK